MDHPGGTLFSFLLDDWDFFFVRIDKSRSPDQWWFSDGTNRVFFTFIVISASLCLSIGLSVYFYVYFSLLSVFLSDFFFRNKVRRVGVRVAGIPWLWLVRVARSWIDRVNRNLVFPGPCQEPGARGKGHERHFSTPAPPHQLIMMYSRVSLSLTLFL